MGVISANGPLLQTITAIFSVFAAVFAGWAAWLSYKLAQRIRDELKADELLIAGDLHHPNLPNTAHSRAVLQTTLFNKSKRKVFVSKVVAKVGANEIPIQWADRIDGFGNPEGGSHLIGITDSAQLCVRHRDAHTLSEVMLEVSHSFSDTPLILHYRLGFE